MAARLVRWGAPHGGWCAAVQAVRGPYAVVRKVARLAAEASAESLAAEIFSTFPSLYDLIPVGAGPTDLLDARAWPPTGPQPRTALLQAARAARGRLAPPDERFMNIVGVGQETGDGKSTTLTSST